MNKVTLESIREAQKTLEGVIKKTPIQDSPFLTKELEGNIFFKLENLQRTGSFKIRGAMNKIASLTEEEKARGVIASSAGNHAQGVALGATAKGIKSTIVMPETAPMAKVIATKGYGAEVVLCGQVYDDAYAKACELQKETGAVFLHPFNDNYVISGQGTIGLEILDELPNVDVVLVPIGGGGILAGIAKAIKSVKPSVKVIGVQTDNVPSMREAMKAGCPIEITSKPTIADGIAVRKCGDLTFEIIKECVDEIVTVSEDEIVNAIFFLLERNKVLAEGAGATAVAAVLAKKIDCKDKNVCAVVSGGNIDINLVNRVINKGLFNEGRRYEFKVSIPNKTGELQKVLDFVKECKGNIMCINQSMFEEIGHTMYETSLTNNSKEVLLVVECIDIEHREMLKNSMEFAGYKIY